MRSVLFLTQRGAQRVPCVEPFRAQLGAADVWELDYTGETEPAPLHLSLASPGGGATMAAALERILPDPGWDYAGFVSHDIHGLTPGAVQMMLDSARSLRLAAFAPGHAEPGIGWPHMRVVSGSYLRLVDWVESRAWWLHRDLCPHLLPYLALSLSAYGVDCYALPSVVRRVCSTRRIAVFDEVPTYHCDEPGRSASGRYQGLSAREEMELVRLHVQRDSGVPVAAV